jgi:hypothetical protein
MRDWQFAEQRLARLEQLLLRPTPEAIREADDLLAETATLLGKCASSSSSPSTTAVEIFRNRCDRVAKLLEGARRAQWIRLRLITSLTQTYTARAETKNWTPPSGTINICM